MKNTLLNDLWYGKIQPFEQDYGQDKECKRLLKRMRTNHERLKKS